MTSLPLPLRLLILIVVAFVAHLPVSAETKSGPPTDAECIAFGEKIAAHLGKGEGAAVVELMDVDGFLNLIVSGIDMNLAQLAGFKIGFKEAFNPTLAREFSNFTHSKFVRLQKVDGKTRILIRSILNNAGVNFTALYPTRAADGTLRWIDAHAYISGETMSETSRRSLLPMVADSKKGLLAKLTGKQDEYVKNFPKLGKISEAVLKGRPEEAIAIVNTLPKSMQRDRAVLVYRLRAGQAFSEESYLAAMNDWRETFPNDPTLDFILIDHAYLKKDYPSAARHIIAFNDAVGGDTQLAFLLATTYLLMERLEDAQKVAAKAYAEEPELNGLFDVLISIALKREEHAEVVRLLNDLGRRYPSADLRKIARDDENYAAFLASKEGQAWATEGVVKSSAKE